MAYTNERALEKYAARVYRDPEQRAAYVGRELGKRTRKHQRQRERAREKEERNYALRQYRYPVASAPART